LHEKKSCEANLLAFEDDALVQHLHGVNSLRQFVSHQENLAESALTQYLHNKNLLLLHFLAARHTLSMSKSFVLRFSSFFSKMLCLSFEGRANGTSSAFLSARGDTGLGLSTVSGDATTAFLRSSPC
jgi:hypothetical protein